VTCDSLGRGLQSRRAASGAPATAASVHSLSCNLTILKLVVRYENPHQKKRPPNWVTLFTLEAWRLCGLTPLSQPLAELASFAQDQAKLFALSYGITPLSHGETHMTETTNP